MMRFVACFGCVSAVLGSASVECEEGGECDASSLLAVNVKTVDFSSRRGGGHHHGGDGHLPHDVQLVKGDAAHCTHHGEVEIGEKGVVAGIVNALEETPASESKTREGALGCHHNHGCIPEPPPEVHWDCHSQKCIVPDTWTCERGTEDDCRATGAFWTGRRCCFNKPMVCAAGLERDCEGRGMRWTGRKCCVCDKNGGAYATAGTKTKCNENGGRWTGTYCFVNAPRTQCDIGIESDCQENGGIFTGFMCCVDERWNCGAGSGNSCSGPGQAWTGFLCCQKGPRQCVAGMKRDCELGCHNNHVLAQQSAEPGPKPGPKPDPKPDPVGPPITWTGSKCCVPEDWTCTAGTINGCDGPHKFWTGTLCCIKGRGATCTAGHETACLEVNGLWTGSRCCLEGPRTCTAGTRNGCTGGPFKAWTGGMCCVDGLQYCKASLERHCHGDHTVFTGTQCCVPEDWICEHRGSEDCGPHESTVGCKCCRPQVF